MYTVLKPFKDKQNNKHKYKKDDIYPVDGNPEKERADYLVEQGYIEEQKQAFPKHDGGAYFKLSNGERVKGKEEAIKAENELK